MLAEPGTTAVFGSYVLAEIDGAPKLLRDQWLLLEGRRIVAIQAQRPLAETVLDAPGRLLLPGLMNLHNHCFSEMVARSNTEDGGARRGGGSVVYTVLLPLTRSGLQILSPEERMAIARMGVLGLLLGGATTVMEPFRAGIPEMFDAAEELGLRFYGAPYLFSTAAAKVGADGRVEYHSEGGADDGAQDLAIWNALHAEWEGRDAGRIRLAMSPHATDTCHPDLLRAAAARAKELGVPVTTHLAQSRGEVELSLQRHGRSPADYLDSLGLLPDLLAAHCVHCSDDDLRLMAARGATVLNCPRVFARGGVAASYAHFRSHGVRTLVGTDGYNLDLLGELNAASMISKIQAGARDVATSPALIGAVTRDAAAAIHRPDLGAIRVGATADITSINLLHPHLQPLADPLRAVVALANRANIDAVIVDGRVLVQNGRHVAADEARITAEGAAAIQRIWDLPEAQAIFAG
ncbi:amidohydrolase family protein [Roseomonas sp. 18066]|uniref:amidohydrolase family protein n=1 Tax=Roseomonas sp. 18066 TaxID=2681412 RepID=UPI00135880C4|nr:amidohydrolase family protein [Roseomonas sp. 18066]